MLNIVPGKEVSEIQVRVSLRPKACACSAIALCFFLLTVGFIGHPISGDTLSVGRFVAGAALCVLFACMALLFRIFERPRDTAVKVPKPFVIHLQNRLRKDAR